MPDLRNYTASGIGRGSELAAIAEVTDTSMATFTFGAPFSLPWVISSSIARAGNQETINGEGEFTLKLEGTKEETLTMTFGQQDGATKDFLLFGMKGKTFIIVKQEHTRAIDGEWQWMVYAMVQEDPSFTKNAIGVEIEKNFNILANSSLLTIDLTGFNTAGGWTPVIAAPGNAVGIPAQQGFALYRQTV